MTIANTIVDVLNSAIKESAPKDWLPVMACEELSPIISTDSRDGWLSLIREKLYSILSVEDIFVSIEGSDVDVWVVIPERDFAILHQIVEREWELVKVLVSGENPPFLVDFHVIYRCGRNVEDLAPTRAIRLPRKVQDGASERRTH